MTVKMSAGQLAIHGGTPVRTTPFAGWPIYDEREEQALIRTLRSGEWGIGGEETELFEQEFAREVGAKYALSVTNGTHALVAALKAADVRFGDEVIVAPYTFVATATAVLLAGAIPVFADIDPETYTLDPAAVEAAITPRTRAIIPVHIAGYPADMDRINQIACANEDLLVIEDTCQAHGAKWRGSPTGSVGAIGCFSFQSSKNINAGEGGAVTTNYADLYEKLWSYKNCGRTRVGGLWYQHDVLGDNYRMTQFQGALLRVQLTRMESWAQRRAENGEYLLAGLRAIGGLNSQRQDERVTRHGFHFILTRYDGEAFGGWPRERFLEALRAEGIPCSRGYIPVYGTGAVRDTTAELIEAMKLPAPPIHCPVTEKACAEEAVWLCGQSALLGTRADMDDILTAVAKVRAAAEGRRAD
jgi:dTDP-4-amino-4,6-dideoxygalactose transaminase